MRGAIPLSVSLLTGCSWIAPLHDHRFDLGGDSGLDAGPDAAGVDAGMVDAGFDAGPSPCNPACDGTTPVCDPDTLTCVRCLADGDCTDNDPCTDDVCSGDHACSSTGDPECPVQLALAATNSCVRLYGGTVRCWGTGGVGELGDGMMMVGPRLSRVVGLDDAIDIDGGSQSTCAVRSDHTVVCWGRGTYGRLGNGAEDHQATPVEVQGLTEAVEVACGDFHGCARREGGSVYCWGLGVYGELGDGMSGGDPDHQSLVATPVLGLDDAIAVAAEANQSCALREGGTAVCWGHNQLGRLGDGTVVSPRSSPRPVVDLTGVTALEGHCAIHAAGVACWGDNTYGEVGNTSTSYTDVPVAVFELTDPVEIATNDNMACAIRRAGPTVCWGRNGEAQLGIGERTTERSVPTLVMNLPDARAIGVSGNHACAIRSDDGIVCWGHNSYGQADPDAAAPDYVLLPTPVTGL